MSKFIHGPLVFTEVRNFTAAGDITMANEAILNVNKASGAATGVTLPPTPKTGRTIFIKDAKGDAATNNITITPASGNVDGAASMTINTNYGSILLQYNGSEWSKLHPTVQVGAVADDTALFLGTDSDTALYHKSASTLANTAVSGVLDGTPVTPALAANSFILSNTTASGDILIAADRGGNSEAYLFVDSSAGDLTLYAPAGEILLNPTTDVQILNGTGLIVGHTAQLTVAGVLPELQVLGTTTGVDGSMTLVTASTTNSARSQLIFGKVGNAALGSFTTVAQGEDLGAIMWVGDDGTDLATVAAMIRAVVNASGTVATSRVPTDLVFYNDPGGGDDAITESMRIGCGGILFIGDNSDANITKGLCINQGAADNVILSLKSSDVGHGATTLAELDSFGTFAKGEAATGGLLISGYKDTDGSVLGNAVIIRGVLDEAAADTTKSTSAVGIVAIVAGIEAGNTIGAAGANENLVVITDGAGATQFIFDVEGSLHGNAAVAEYDEYDDWALVRAYGEGKQGFVRNKWDQFVTANKQLLVDLGIIGKTKGLPGEKPLVNQTKLAQLHNGAIGQLGAQLYDVVNAILTSSSLDEVKAKLPEALKAKLLPAA